MVAVHKLNPINSDWIQIYAVTSSPQIGVNPFVANKAVKGCHSLAGAR
ncbi:hypothetical protein L539_2064 [Bordetella hinzii 5132]|nr:hypothetical protein L539_2064 [Bordetella hinzii 5132]